MVGDQELCDAYISASVEFARLAGAAQRDDPKYAAIYADWARRFASRVAAEHGQNYLGVRTINALLREARMAENVAGRYAPRGAYAGYAEAAARGVRYAALRAARRARAAYRSTPPGDRDDAFYPRPKGGAARAAAAGYAAAEAAARRAAG